MRKLFFLWMIIWAGALSAQVTPTEYVGENPFLFTPNWPMRPRVTYIHDSIVCTEFLIPCLTGRDAIWGGNGLNYPPEIEERFRGYAIKQYSEDTIHIVGVAELYADEDIPWHMVTIMDTDFNILRMVLDSFPLLQQETGSGDGRCYTHRFAIETRIQPYRRMFYYHFFDTPIDIKGDFYMGFSLCDNKDGWNQRMICIRRIFEQHEPPYGFPVLQQAVQYREDLTWQQFAFQCLPTQFPLIDPECAIPTPYVECVDDSCVRIEWDSTCYVLTDTTEGLFPWQVRYAPVGGGIPTVTDCCTTECIIGGLIPGVRYDFSVRSRCDRIGNPHWTSWSAPETTIVGNNTGIFPTAHAGTITLAPNPARGSVTVSSSTELKSIVFYNAQGVMMLNQTLSGYSVEVNIDGLLQGAYVVDIITTNGTASKKLVIK